MTATTAAPDPGAPPALPPELRRNSRTQLLLVFAAWTLIAAFDIGKRFVESRMYGRTLDLGEVLLNLESAWVWTAFTPLIFFLYRESMRDLEAMLPRSFVSSCAAGPSFR